MPTLTLYRFRYFDPIRNKWQMARYAAERQDIEARYRQFEIIGVPETRTVPERDLQQAADACAAYARTNVSGYQLGHYKVVGNEVGYAVWMTSPTTIDMGGHVNPQFVVVRFDTVHNFRQAGMVNE